MEGFLQTFFQFSYSCKAYHLNNLRLAELGLHLRLSFCYHASSSPSRTWPCRCCASPSSEPFSKWQPLQQLARRKERLCEALLGPCLGCKPRAKIAGRILASLEFQSCKARTQRSCSLTSCWWERLPHSALYANFCLRAEISFGSWPWTGPCSERLGTCDWWNRSMGCRLWVYRIQVWILLVWSLEVARWAPKDEK